MKILIIAQNKNVTSIAMSDDKKTIAQLKKHGYAIAGNTENMAQARSHLLGKGYTGYLLHHTFTKFKYSQYG